MRRLVIDWVVKNHMNGLDEWPAALCDTRDYYDPIVKEASFLRDYGNEYEIRDFLNQRTDEELLAMFTQQNCQDFR